MFDFKTSYVTVYLAPENPVATFHANFKTSYVTVYRLAHNREHKNTRISKHRMLLFIDNVNGFGGNLKEFQNIVCYCLSFRWHGIAICKSISKHRMLLFIQFQPWIRSSCDKISKHRMLLFIGKLTILDESGNIDFKTSYVTVYPTWQISFYAKKPRFQNIVCYCLSNLVSVIRFRH